MELARRRFQQAEMGAEMHAGTADDLEQVMRFRPSTETSVVVHLPRHFNLSEEQSRNQIVQLASRFAGRIYGMVLHDHADLVEHPQAYQDAARDLEHRLERALRMGSAGDSPAPVGDSPNGMAEDNAMKRDRHSDSERARQFRRASRPTGQASRLCYPTATLLTVSRHLSQVHSCSSNTQRVWTQNSLPNSLTRSARTPTSAPVLTSATWEFARPGTSMRNFIRPKIFCALKSNPSALPGVIADVESAVAAALPTVLRLVEEIGRLGKPVHFHLHDGHPLSTFSLFDVSDHLSFFTEIPLDFTYRGRRFLPPMYGPAGLSKIVTTALEAIEPDRVSFTLEIHPTADRLALGDAADLFSHWQDKTNAEMMNHWLGVLLRNHELLLQAIRAAEL